MEDAAAFEASVEKFDNADLVTLMKTLGIQAEVFRKEMATAEQRAAIVNGVLAKRAMAATK